MKQYKTCLGDLHSCSTSFPIPTSLMYLSSLSFNVQKFWRVYCPDNLIQAISTSLHPQTQIFFLSWILPNSWCRARLRNLQGNASMDSLTQSLYGPQSMHESAEKISKVIVDQAKGDAIIVMAHNGPRGLGSRRHDPCGKDFRPEEGTCLNFLWHHLRWFPLPANRLRIQLRHWSCCAIQIGAR